MIFEKWELERICKNLDDKTLADFGIKMKLEEIMKKSVNKRFSLRTTDWCVENGKKSRKEKKNGKH